MLFSKIINNIIQLPNAYAAGIQNMQWQGYLAFSVLFIIFCGIFLRRFYKNLIKARLLEDTPTARIRSAAQGYVELNGTQYYYNNTPYIAPLSLLPCTWYRYEIYHTQKGNHSRTQTLLIANQTSHAPFLIKDKTGETCIIYPDSADITSPIKDTWHGFKPFPQGKPKNWFWRIISSFGSYYYIESRMTEGMNLYALGYFSTEENKINNINILSKNNLNNRQPFVLSANDRHKIIREYKTQATIYAIAFILWSSFTVWWLMIRL